MLVGEGPKSNMDVKKINRRKVLELILHSEAISNREISSRLGLTFPTVVQFIKDFQSKKIVVETGTFESTGGRKAKSYAPNLDTWFAVGIDITRNHLTIGIVDIAGNNRGTKRILSTYRCTDEYFRSIGKRVDETIAEFAPPKCEIIGVGISVPGIVNEESNELIRSHILDEENLKLETIAQYIPYPCSMMNDANAGGYAEFRSSTTSKNAIYFSLSNSVGGSLFINGVLFYGDRMCAGEIGHMTIVPGGQQCYCGKKGCLDAYCAAHLLHEKQGIRLADFFDKLKQGDKESCKIWKQYLEHLSIAVCNIRVIFDCDIILGGYVGAFLDDYIDDLRKLVDERNPFEKNGEYVKACTYKYSAAAIGAALPYVEQFLQNN